MNILITGATGFVGQHLRRYLLESTDYKLVGTVYPEPVSAPLASNHEQLVSLDLKSAEVTRSLLAQVRPDGIIHLAAQSHVPTSFQDPWATIENNVRGQLNLLQACVDLGIAPRIVIIGSGEEYGHADLHQLPLREDHPLQPVNPYSVSKVAQDVLGYQYYASYGLPVVRMRPFNHIGPGQSERFVLPAFASQIAKAEMGLQSPILHVGNLDPARDFTDVRDVVRAYCLALLRGRPGEAYNVASGEPRRIRWLLAELQGLATVDIEVVVDPERYRPSDVPVIYGSADKLAADTGWTRSIDIRQTIADVLSEWRTRVRGS